MGCKVEGCTGDEKATGAARGYCAKHYRRLARRGSVEIAGAVPGTVTGRCAFALAAEHVEALDEVRKHRGLATLSALMREIVDAFLQKDALDRLSTPKRAAYLAAQSAANSRDLGR